jgi:hypothetical protein
VIILINGRREQGKTTLAYSLSLRRPTRVIFDPRRMFATSPIVISDPLLLFDLMDRYPEIIVQPETDVQETFLTTAQEFREWSLANPEEPCVLLVDESRFIDTPNITYEPFEAILRFSPTDLVDVIMTSHRPSDINVDIRAIADFLIYFRTTQEHDLKVIVQRCGTQEGELVERLPDKNFLVWDDRLALYKVQQDPASWYVDIKKVNSANMVEDGSVSK